MTNFEFHEFTRDTQIKPEFDARDLYEHGSTEEDS